MLPFTILNQYGNKIITFFDAKASLLSNSMPFVGQTIKTAFDGNFNIYLWGSTSNGTTITNNNLYSYNIISEELTLIETDFSSSLSRGQDMCYVDNMLYVFGSGENNSKNCFKYNIITKVKTPIETYPVSGNGVSAHVYNKNIVIVIDGNVLIYSIDENKYTVHPVNVTYNPRINPPSSIIENTLYTAVSTINSNVINFFTINLNNFTYNSNIFNIDGAPPFNYPILFNMYNELYLMQSGNIMKYSQNNFISYTNGSINSNIILVGYCDIPTKLFTFGGYKNGERVAEIWKIT